MCRNIGRGMGGFTLVELMVVVLIVGMLAALTVPLFNRYVKKSKSSEASTLISTIYTAEVTYFEQSDDQAGTGGLLPDPQYLACSTSPSTPPDSALHTGTWVGNWTALGFSTDYALYYQYSVTAEGTAAGATATITAHGDLDGNGDISTFQRNLSVNSNGDAVGAPLIIVNGLE